jgi:hypothetical protein
LAREKISMEKLRKIHVSDVKRNNSRLFGTRLEGRTL